MRYTSADYRVLLAWHETLLERFPDAGENTKIMISALRIAVEVLERSPRPISSSGLYGSVPAGAKPHKGEVQVLSVHQSPEPLHRASQANPDGDQESTLANDASQVRLGETE